MLPSLWLYDRYIHTFSYTARGPLNGGRHCAWLTRICQWRTVKAQYLERVCCSVIHTYRLTLDIPWRHTILWGVLGSDEVDGVLLVLDAVEIFRSRSPKEVIDRFLNNTKSQLTSAAVWDFTRTFIRLSTHYHYIFPGRMACHMMSEVRRSSSL